MEITIHANGKVYVKKLPDNSLQMPLSKIIFAQKLPLNMPCGGRGSCKKCKVIADGMLSVPTKAELLSLTKAEVDAHVRLACMTYPIGDCVVNLLGESSTKTLADGSLSEFAFMPLSDGFGFAVDIGTTTVAVSLLSLEDGKKLGTAAFDNPQRSFGDDVISRIQADCDGNGGKLHALIKHKIQGEMIRLCSENSIAQNKLTSAVITGNTTMLYLFCKISTQPMSRYPFSLSEKFGKDGYCDFCFEEFPKMLCRFPKTIQAFVGSDVTCAILASKIYMQNRPTLLVDIGTNGEMAICVDSKLYCCSTAAGPAFEGVGITMGTTAVCGSIDHVKTLGKKMIYSTIPCLDKDKALPPKKAIGICGSGLIDAVAACLTLKLIDETGFISEEIQSEYLCEYQSQSAIRIGDSEVYLTQLDIRAVQLAKAAIFAGIESLLHAACISTEQVDKFVIAGGFGNYIDIESAVDISMFPQSLLPKAVAIGNAALMGATMMELSETELAASERIAADAQPLELATSEFFMERYIKRLDFAQSIK